MRRPVLPILFAAAVFAPSLAAAAPEDVPRGPGSFFLLEVGTGLSEPAYSHGNAALAYSLTAGMTFKLKALPLRFAFLTTFAGRNASSTGESSGVPYASSRIDLDLYVAHRIALPIIGGLRIYGEAGVGHRWSLGELQRGSGLGDLSENRGQLLVVLAAGLQYRISENISVGLRGELTPIDEKLDLISAATGDPSTSNRVALIAQLGLHF